MQNLLLLRGTAIANDVDIFMFKEEEIVSPPLRSMKAEDVGGLLFRSLCECVIYLPV